MNIKNLILTGLSVTSLVVSTSYIIINEISKKNDVTIGEKGDDGRGIESIELTSSEGLVDTYTITYSDGTTSTFTITNGKDGDIEITGSIDLKIGENGNWFINGEDTGVNSKGEDGRSIVSIEKTSSFGNIDTYTITYSDGTTSTFTISNGKDGEKGDKGDTGDTGDSAFDIFKKYHPEYTGNEEDWLNAMFLGDTCSTLGSHVESDEITYYSDYNLDEWGSRTYKYKCKFCGEECDSVNLVYPKSFIDYMGDNYLNPFHLKSDYCPFYLY